MSVSVLVRRHQSTPLFLNIIDMKFGLDVNFTDSFEVLIQIPEQLVQMLFVPLPDGNLFRPESL